MARVGEAIALSILSEGRKVRTPEAVV